MILLKCFMILITIFPFLVKAEFQSQQELVLKLETAGIEQIISIKNPDLGNLFLSANGVSNVSLQSYLLKQSPTRLSSFDILPSSYFSKNLEAYEVANKFICFKKQGDIQRSVVSTRYQLCILSSSDVKSMINAISGKDPSVDQRTSSQQ